MQYTLNEWQLALMDSKIDLLKARMKRFNKSQYAKKYNIEISEPEQMASGILVYVKKHRFHYLMVNERWQKLKFVNHALAHGFDEKRLEELQTLKEPVSSIM